MMNTEPNEPNQIDPMQPGLQPPLPPHQSGTLQPGPFQPGPVQPTGGEGRMGQVHAGPTPTSQQVTIFDKDYRAVIGTILWSWVLFWIPVPFQLWAISSRKLTLYGVTTLEVKSGALSKNFQNVDLYRVKNVSAAESVFSGGRLFITTAEGETIRVPHVKDAGRVAHTLRAAVDQSRRDYGMSTRENI
ncbi:PH domain-containing protein [Nesterenkonia sp. HG001]|uniref:PH domain-containing protein n=1 Tax=Nesterenkonia sp. HG001 TaxID=2983207 RepID=UPI002AC55000|nr:PH domain-containing protein [Nesterenkonia sp. HG001]MDZ5076714.1 hypothetical protein [Nesterenkonia sp. HG001]